VKLSPEYVAGFLDGEGCIRISPRKVGAKRQTYFQLFVCIVNTNLVVLDRIREQYGGFIKQAKRSGNRKPCWEYIAHSRIAYNLLTSVGPHLIVKREQYELGMAFWAFMHQPRLTRFTRTYRIGKHGTRGGLTGETERPESIAQRLEFKEQMHSLNKRGIA
jgi:hypothetical protein